jgi:DNA repair exonuclease SbcCD ATPase subunit
MQIKTIAHLADIHIRKLHRFVEYREVFARLYKQLKDLKPDLIFLGGDIIHSKLDISPESVRMVSNFFIQLSDIAPTIIIPGNHDTNLNNISREDALSPIVDLVQKSTDNLYYWKDSGIYTLGNIDFGVMSIFDVDDNGNQLTTKLPNPADMANDHKIALFHGGVGTHLYDNGFSVTDKHVSIQTFDGYDLTLLGDIHLRQFLNNDETIGYPGSLIQQGFAEVPAHGFLLWDIETKKAKFHQVENDYGFKSIDVIDGILQNKMKYIPPKGHVKIKYWNSTLEQIKDIQLDLKKKYPKLKSLKAEKQDILSKINGRGIHKINIGDVRDIKYQNELITEYLANNIKGIDAETIKRVCDINEMTNNSPEIDSGDTIRNVDWKLKSFEFDNMFSYGENNKIDFKKLDGIVGVVAPNHSGKSSILSSIAYTIFDTCDRTSKAIDVLNKKKTKFKSKLNIEVNDENYWIERTGKLRSRTNRQTNKTTYTCPVDVKFQLEDGDEMIDLSGAARKNSQYGGGTNEEIKKLLGTFDDFILTALSLQTNGSNFVEKKQWERKQILSQFMDIDIFEQLYELGKQDSIEDRTLLKAFKKRDSYTELITIDDGLAELTKAEKEISKQDSNISNKLTELENAKIELIQKLYEIDELYDIDDLTTELQNTTAEKQSIQKQLGDDKEYRETLRPLYNEYHTKLAELDEEKIDSDCDKYKDLMIQANQTNNNIKSILEQIKSNKELLEELEKYKYDEDCDYCVNNGQEHITHQKNISDKLNKLQEDYNDVKGTKVLVDYAIEKIKDAEQNKKDFDIFSDELNQVTQDAYKIGGKITTQETRLDHIDSNIKSINAEIVEYNELAEKIKKNNDYNNHIQNITDDIIKLHQDEYNIDLKYKKILSEISVSKNDKQRIEDDIQKLIDIEQRIQDYDLYLLSMSRDGIPYNLISQTISIIEHEINQVLDNMMVGFTLKLEMDGKNINVSICYDNACWSLELASGMERFVSNLAIRIGLINVSTLPRSSFIVIDEGFGTLDGDNIANMEGAFNYLKTQFDFVLVVTHLDIIKDYMDTLIPINTNNGFSKVNFV